MHRGWKSFPFHRQQDDDPWTLYTGEDVEPEKPCALLEFQARKNKELMERVYPRKETTPGRKPRGMAKKLFNRYGNQLKEDFDNGKPVGSVAKAYGVSYGLMCRVRNMLGFKGAKR